MWRGRGGVTSSLQARVTNRNYSGLPPQLTLPAGESLVELHPLCITKVFVTFKISKAGYHCQCYLWAGLEAWCKVLLRIS